PPPTPTSPLSLHDALPILGQPNAFGQWRACAPAQRSQPRYVEQLARRAVRLGAVKLDASFEADDTHHRLGEFTDRHVLPAADVQDRKSTRLNSSHLGISYA